MESIKILKKNKMSKKEMTNEVLELVEYIKGIASKEDKDLAIKELKK